MNLYSKLEKHLPREKDCNEHPGNSNAYFCVIKSHEECVRCKTNISHNQCKAQYDEVLKRVAVDEDKLFSIVHEWSCSNSIDTNSILDQEKLIQAIATSPDVVKLENEQEG